MINEFNINIKVNALEESNSDGSNEILSCDLSKYNHESNPGHEKLVYGKYLCSVLMQWIINRDYIHHYFRYIIFRYRRQTGTNHKKTIFHMKKNQTVNTKQSDTLTLRFIKSESRFIL